MINKNEKTMRIVTLGIVATISALPQAESAKVELKKYFPTKQLENEADVKWSHAPYNRGKCSLCHQSDNIQEPGEMKASVNRICLSCHKQEQDLQKKHPGYHEPVAKDCGYCHNAHNSQYKKLLYRPMIELCITCHQEQKREMKSKTKHDPVFKEQACENCHDSHGSNYEDCLVMPKEKLCFDCHGGKKGPVKDERGRVLSDVASLVNKKVKHQPFKENNCSACHNSHGSENTRLLIGNYPEDFYTRYEDRQYELCYKCHKKERITTPKTATLTGFCDGDKNLHFVHVVKPKNGRSCRACHEDHATESVHLVRESVPYGPEGWSLELNYVENTTGGQCSKTCHDKKTYNNKGRRPKDIASEYKKRQPPPNLSAR